MAQCSQQEHVDVFASHVEDHEPQDMALSFDKQIDVALGQFEITKFHPFHCAVLEGASVALEDPGIERLVAHAAEEIPASSLHSRRVLVAGVSLVTENELSGNLFGLRKEVPLCLAIGRDSHRNRLAVVKAVCAVDFDRCRGVLGESSREVIDEGVIDLERTPVLHDDVLESPQIP